MIPQRTPIDIAIASLAVFVVPGLSAWSGRALARTPSAERRLVRRYWWIILRSLAIVALVVVTWIQSGRSFAMLGLDVPVGPWGRVGFAVDALIVAYYAYAIVLRKRSAVDLARTRERLRSMHSDRMLPTTRAERSLFPAVAIAGSVFEELVYRGFLIWFFAPATGVLGAVVISALAFGLGHVYLGWIGVVRTTAIGGAFGAAFVATGSLWWLMLAHIAVNLFGAPLQRRLSDSNT